MKSHSKFQEKTKIYQTFLFKHSAIICVYLISTLVNLSFRNTIPTNAGFNAPHDDLLGVRLANNILEGNWLGNWDSLTLAKPPGYSIYLSVTHFFPIQLVVLNQILFCSISLIFSFIVTKFLIRSHRIQKWIAASLYTFLIFNPYLFGIEMSRIYRTSTHTINVFAFCVIFVLLLVNLENLIKDSKDLVSKRPKIYLSAIFLGLSYSSLVLLRNESYWVLFSSLPFLTGYLLYLLRPLNKIRRRDKNLSGIILPVMALFFVSYFVPITFLGQVNNAIYGTSLLEDYYAGNFGKAIKNWQRVNVGKDSRPYVIISKTQRAAVYEVSPTASLMKDFLELPAGQGWQGQPCNSPIKLCDNAGGWVTWQIRDAALATGKIQNAVDFQEFFKTIATDIEIACTNRIFECTKPGLGVGTKSIYEMPLKSIGEYAFQNLVDYVPKNWTPTGEVSTPDSFGASAEVVNAYHKVANYDVKSSNVNELDSVHKTLFNLQQIYFPFQQVLLYFALLGFVLSFWNPRRRFIFSILGFCLTAMLANSVGVAITQVSFGWRVGTGIYLLPLAALFQIFIIIGIVALISTLEELKKLSFKRRKALQ